MPRHSDVRDNLLAVAASPVQAPDGCDEELTLSTTGTTPARTPLSRKGGRAQHVGYACGVNTELLKLTGVAAIISAITTLLTLVLKEYFFARWFERWKRRQELERIYRRLRDPLFVASVELGNRLHEMMDVYGASFLRRSVLALAAERQERNSADDPYFLKYKLVSSVYRLCAFLGWLELYRELLVFFDVESERKNRTLTEYVGRARADLADGHLNTREDWELWRDTLLFREEQRAIGEAMLEGDGEDRRVIGYGRFCELFAGPSDARGRWFHVALSFLADPDRGPCDFQTVRVQRLAVHATDLAQVLYPGRVSEWLTKRTDSVRSNLEAAGWKV